MRTGLSGELQTCKVPVGSPRQKLSRASSPSSSSRLPRPATRAPSHHRVCAWRMTRKAFSFYLILEFVLTAIASRISC